MPVDPAHYTCKLSHPVEDLRKEVLRHFRYWEYPADRPSFVLLWLPESARNAWMTDTFGWADRQLVLLGAHPRSTVEVVFFEEFRGVIDSAAGNVLTLRLENERAELVAEVGAQHLVAAPQGPLAGRRVRALRIQRLDGQEAYQVHVEAELCLS